jgi:predicted nucleic acid-binding protein
LASPLNARTFGRQGTSPMNPKTYVETTIISYLTAYPSRDLVRAAHQQVTAEWWTARMAYDIYISQLVIDEARRGDPAAAARRVQSLDGFPLLNLTDEVVALAEDLIVKGGLPQKARIDALHVAIATIHGMDYLLTWNLRDPLNS